MKSNVFTNHQKKTQYFFNAAGGTVLPTRTKSNHLKPNAVVLVISYHHSLNGGSI